MTYFFETYGCQMNVAESASVEQLLLKRGWEKAEKADVCDLLIINTCSVRITAETRVFGRLGLFSALKKKRAFSIILMGCMAERLHDKIKKDFPRLDYVVGMFERNQFTAIFKEIESKLNKTDYHSEFSGEDFLEKPVSGYHFAESSYIEGAFQSFIPIMNGCNNFCTYCIVPYVRGREISRSLEAILAEVEELSEKGVREITLLGQNVNSYRGKDFEGKLITFPELLRRVARVCEKKDSIRWIRFMSSHPKDFSDELITVIAEEPRVCKLIHLPVQHGSNAVLKRMNRSYTREHYLSLVDKLRTKVPDSALSTDILIGFPGESEEDFELTLDLMRQVQFDSAFMYHYNPREGTRAYDFPDRIPDAVRIARLQQVIDLQMKTSAEKMRNRVNHILHVLVESRSRNNPDELFGHTEFGEMAVLTGADPENSIGHFVKVQIQSVQGKTFRTIPIKSED
ncbi:tRNA-i(6)A37 thiotransferase enzyme MiaB [Treponema phagedenis F0421]|uniref:tRNA (N6-isopentenyl adenosine(37)-C2)-methylthiotransferase MiaB n=1 Tax=Treponema phagedenis TaxID=162 RepID=UPI0001F63BDF|nr:tRNA (N6-isopentenyl adenosine(37)-C2)-methylthiotransferase MiaB [Treponema phagedenis]EFW38177.1 tRNA-i(6)A37 thiotransferase enzyme MiaB [Treponema phagedenis F0421]